MESPNFPLHAGRDLISGEPKSRTKREVLLEQPTRRRIMEELEKRPGLNKRRLCDHLDLYMSQVDQHVRRLQKADLVVTRPSPREREVLVFRAEDADLWENERTRILYGREPVRQAALYLAEHPGASSQEIADAMDLTAITVRHHLRTLREHKLVATLQIGRSYEYHPSNELREWAQTIGKHFERPHEGDDGDD